MISNTLEQEALNLKAIDKIHLVEKLLNSLDKPDEIIESTWVAESEQRYDAYRQGKLKSTDWEEIQERYSS